jgi:hypothetical protein
MVLPKVDVSRITSAISDAATSDVIFMRSGQSANRHEIAIGTLSDSRIHQAML